MKRDKKFDCVKMKRDIQARIAKEFEGMLEDQARKIQDERVDKKPILGPFLRKIQKRQAQAFRKGA